MTQWDKIRKEVMYRDTNQCQSCAKHIGLLVHHKIPRSKGGSDEPENLITLCVTCHRKFEPKPPKLNLRWTTIRILKTTKEIISRQGKKGETYDSIIDGLIQRTK